MSKNTDNLVKEIQTEIKSCGWKEEVDSKRGPSSHQMLIVPV